MVNLAQSSSARAANATISATAPNAILDVRKVLSRRSTAVAAKNTASIGPGGAFSSMSLQANHAHYLYNCTYRL